MENRKRKEQKERESREKGIREERNGTERKEYDTKDMKGEKRIGSKGGFREKKAKSEKKER